MRTHLLPCNRWVWPWLALFCLLFTACAREEQPAAPARSPGKLREVSPGEYEKIIGTGKSEPKRAGRTETGKHQHRESGYLQGPGYKDRFVVIAKHKQVDLNFKWPRGKVDFWVKVYGKNDNLLGDFDLDNGEIIQLLGGDKFTVEVYSKSGGGPWEVTYED